VPEKCGTQVCTQCKFPNTAPLGSDMGRGRNTVSAGRWRRAPQRVQRSELQHGAAGLVREAQEAVAKQLLRHAQGVLQLRLQLVHLRVLYVVRALCDNRSPWLLCACCQSSGWHIHTRWPS